MECTQHGNHHHMKSLTRSLAPMTCFTRRALAPVLPLIAVAAGVLAALYVIAVCTTSGQLVEDAAVLGSDQVHSDPSWAQRALATLADDRAIVVAVAIPLLLGWWRRHLAIGCLVAGGVLATNVTTQVLKGFVFVRPELVPDAGVGTGNSLPSGTVTFLLSVALGTAIMLPDSRLGRVIRAVLPAFALVAGGATIVLDWHRPADVFAGVLVVAAWFVVIRSAVDRMAGGSADVTPDRSGSLIAMMVAAGSLCVAPLTAITLVPGLAEAVAAHAAAVYPMALLIVTVASTMVIVPLVRVVTGHTEPHPVQRELVGATAP